MQTFAQVLGLFNIEIDLAIVFMPFSPQRYGKKMKDERKGEENLQITVITDNSLFFKGWGSPPHTTHSRFIHEKSPTSLGSQALNY